MTEATHTELLSIVSKLSPSQSRAIRWARHYEASGPARVRGMPGVTRKALRERGLAHGDLCYLTPLGEQVRQHLLSNQEKGK